MLALLVFLAGAAQAQLAPEIGTGRAEKPLAVARHSMVAAAHPLAVAAGRAILAAGGNAVDAAVAVQLVLNLVEPQSSGVGGGAFLLLWSAAEGRIVSYDGRETAPAAARPDRFVDADGKPLAFRAAVVGGRSVGVPGTIAMLERAHREHGKLPWADLFAPALKLAEDGFPMGERLSRQLAAERDLPRHAPARDYFYDADGTPKPPGTLMRNPAFADTLRALARDGAKALSQGPIAADIVATVQAAGGDLTQQDLAAYRPKEREPVCGPYRIYVVCGMGPPSSGGIAVLQILALLEAAPVPAAGSAEAVHRIGQAMALAFADRAHFLADPDFLPVPVKGLLDAGYLRQRSQLIQPDRAFGKAPPGQPPERQGRLWGADASPEFPSTSHVSIVDAAGNALALTTTIEDGFGARLMVRGFLLNNELTDFSFLPENDGRPVANRVEGGKRPRSSMAPTIVLKDNKPILVLGSPGGAAIIAYVAKTLVGVLDWGLDVQQAAALPNFLDANFGALALERGTALEALRPALQAMGHRVTTTEFTSGLHAIRIFPDHLEGGADPRREGVARGD